MVRFFRRRRGVPQDRLVLERLESRAMLHGTAALAGMVYFDADRDGIRDSGELGVPGVVVRLSAADAGNTDANQETLTDDNGHYAFEELEPGSYRIIKRQPAATFTDASPGSNSGSTPSEQLIQDVVLADDQLLSDNNFGEAGLKPEFITIQWFFASNVQATDLLRETIARSEELAGDPSLAASIRAGGDVPAPNIHPPTTLDDVYSMTENTTLTISASGGLLANDSDADGDTLTAALATQATHGTAAIQSDGSFTYTPNADFTGADSFTYRASDGTATSGETTVRITVNSTTNTNDSPVAADDSFTIEQDSTLTIESAAGVLVNDTDADGDPLAARLVDLPQHGTATLQPNGGFTYTPTAGYTGSDRFTYRANDGTADSNLGTVAITVTVRPAALFGPVTQGSFDDAGLLGVRTDLVAGAPAIVRDHVDGDIDYTGYSNPPTYGNHHGSDPEGTDVNPGITPRPTGVYTTEQPDEDLIHNLEHGHVWISYNPDEISASDLAALEQLVIDGSPNPNGRGVGVILTPRAANDSMIALASWARLLKLEAYDPTTIRNFVETNRGHSPEGFITP